MINNNKEIYEYAIKLRQNVLKKKRLMYIYSYRIQPDIIDKYFYEYIYLINNSFNSSKDKQDFNLLFDKFLFYKLWRLKILLRPYFYNRFFEEELHFNYWVLIAEICFWSFILVLMLIYL